jgi:uncharacterized linocin/CFP29 family protein
MDLGRDRLNWTQDVWKKIDDAVHDEFQRTAVAAKFIPLYGPVADALTVASDIIDLDTMTVDEVAVTPLLELSVEFGLTRQQVAGEAQLSTSVTLATRAANLLSQGEDLSIFRGDEGFNDNLFKRVRHRGGSAGAGLLRASDQAVQVTPVSTGPQRYGEHTFEAVAEAYSFLQNKGHYGPYALALRSEVYADTFAPLPDTLAMPADRITPLVTLGFYGTGTLPPSTGVLVSVGGNTMDLVAAVDPITEFLQVDDKGLYRFRVFERFALRVKDKTAIVRLEFR